MIICAALLVQINGLEQKTIIPCHRHPSGYEILHDFHLAGAQYKPSVEEGFIDHHGKFLDRYEAFDHALMCGQLSQTTRDYKDDNMEYCKLYSEDLY